MKGTFVIFAAVAVSFASCGTCRTDGPVYLDSLAPLEERVEDALSRMTLEEKVAMTHAQSKFSSPGVPRLGIPELWCTDGPHGIRPEVYWDMWDQAGWTNDSCTAYPALTGLAATWNEELSHLYGKSIGEEARYRNKSVLLGPGVNICRSPLNGRNFEYMGEDPFLASKMVVPYVKGVQENGVAACVKHFALNNTESNRHTSNIHVDDRTLYEIYLPAFKAAVQEGDAWAIMGSYNLYKDLWCSQNPYLLNTILKQEWGFDGVVISDWGAVHDTEQAVKNGLDLEFGSWTNGLSEGKKNAYASYFLADPYLEGIRSGKYGTEELDDKCRRILRLIFRTEMAPNRPYGRFTCPEHYEAARRIGAESIVLLKNEGLLPIDRSKTKTILVVGENAVRKMCVGGGSSSLKVQHEVTPLEGLRTRYADLEIKYERGYISDAPNEYNGVSAGADLAESRSAGELVADAVKVAENVDLVIYIGGLNKADYQDCENSDRRSYNLPYGQDELISALLQVNRNMIVINISGNPVAMPWVDSVPAIVQSWYLGSEAGTCIASVLSGDVNPSGKLPFTYPVAYEDGPLRTEKQYPGLMEGKTGGVEAYDVPLHDMYYSEGVFVGYRWYESKAIKPLFAFGHGLSYTDFSLANIRADKNTMGFGDKLTVSAEVENTGSCAGAEVVQLYVQDYEATVMRPLKELKGFKKVFLQPGEKKTVEMELTVEDLSFFDVESHSWKAEPGKFVLHVGTSSDHIVKSLEINLK